MTTIRLTPSNPRPGEEALLVLTVSEPTGKVDVTFFEPTKTRKHWQRTGNRFMMAPWSTVVATFNPRPTCRVIVRRTSEAF